MPHPDDQHDRQPDSNRDERFPRRLRLIHRLQYQAVHAAKVRVNAGPLLVYALPNDVGESRLGLSVSRRVGTAVRRNAIKRRLREAFRTSRADLPAGYDIVVSVRPHDPEKTQQYRAWLLDAMKRLDKRYRKRWPNRAPTPPPTDPAPPPGPPNDPNSPGSEPGRSPGA